MNNPNSLMNRSQSLVSKSKPVASIHSTITPLSNIKKSLPVKSQDPLKKKKKKMMPDFDNFGMFEPTNSLGEELKKLREEELAKEKQQKIV